MRAPKWILLITFLSASSASVGSNVDGVSLSHFEPLERISVQGKGGLTSQKAADTGPIDLSFDVLGRNFELQLEPNANLLAAIPFDQRLENNIPYRGQIAGSSDSWARIVMVDGMPAGLVYDGDALYAIEAPGDSIVDSASSVAYRLSDLLVAPGALSCASGGQVTSGDAMYKSILTNVGSVVSQGPGAVSELNLGAVGDYEFTSAKGANAQSAILTRLNNVDGIYSQQLGVQINVPFIETFTDINDPFSDASDAGDLLLELNQYRIGNPSQRNQGLTHLFTGRGLAGSTVGIAWASALCSTTFGTGLSEGNSSSTIDSMIAAHEIGHNFGAPHDGEPGSPCAAEPSNVYIMAPQVNTSGQFSACSITQMQDDIAGASCITALPSTDISVVFNDASLDVLLSNIARATLDVVNNGTELAQNVVVDITLPANVSYIDASGGSATCASGAGTVSCQLGDVAGGSATTIAITADTDTVGVGSVTASVTADADDVPGNNQDSVQLTVDPAVNLVINAPADRQVIQDQSTTVSTTLDNLSPMDATNVTLSIALDAGLRADTATWSIGTCNVTAQQIDCQANQLNGQSSASLSVGVTGLTTGNKSYTVTLAADETDADRADNSAQGSVRVNSPNGGSNDDEGGGSFGWLFLLLLAATSMRAKHSHCEPA
jgi:hypothetical protein